ncbi:MAG: hypothetical protein H0T79_10795 [Deltaproteobacteria bacterium]|nr:hypothetical protein [Deltaproteobacteria bacterium]
MAALSAGISTVFASRSTPTVIRVAHSALPGARAEIVYVPPSIGSALSNAPRSIASPSRRISNPPTRLASGTMIVNVDNRDSSFVARSTATARRLLVSSSVAARVCRSASRNNPHAVASWLFFSRQLARFSKVDTAGSSFWLASNAAHASASLPAAISSRPRLNRISACAPAGCADADAADIATTTATQGNVPFTRHISSACCNARAGAPIV